MFHLSIDWAQSLYMMARVTLAAVLAGIEPVEQSGAPAADMEEAGRRGRKAGDDGFGHVRWFNRSQGR